MCGVIAVNAYFQIKKQQENINGLYDIVKKYESDISDLQTKAEHMEVELKDSKLKYIQQVRESKCKSRK
jgi:hypothetical protein